uniref:No apical meristem-associated C-terminal domain-containing protein n=1 Tax=Fagus sylvatica TaxID=28930 RepID=A0A2N9I4J3_FAGSY
MLQYCRRGVGHRWSEASRLGCPIGDVTTRPRQQHEVEVLGPSDALLRWLIRSSKIHMVSISPDLRMGMDSQGNMSFTNLLQEDSNLDKELLGESQHTPMSIQESPFQVDMILFKSKRQAGNFTVEEDKLLVLAWLNTSLDPIQGNEQKLDSFYTRIWANEPKWLQFKPKEKHKRSNSLPQTTQTPDSDQAFGDKVSHDSFVDLERPIGRKAEKAKRKRKDNEKEDVAVFMDRKTKFLEDACEVEKELIRMKGEKIRLEELRMMEKTRLEELRMTEKINIEKERLCFEQAKEDGRMHIEEERMRIEEERMRMEDERMRREEERLQLKRNKEEERIMMIDISGLSGRQQQYYDQLQMDILKSQVKKT